MKKDQPNAVCLGDLVAAAYDAAGNVSHDDRSAAVLAAHAVRKLLLKAGRMDLARRLADLQLTSRPVAA